MTLQLLRIDDLLENGEFEQGLLLAKQCKKEYGGHPLYGWQLDGRMGLALMLMGDYSGSVPFFEAAIRIRPLEPIFHLNLASALVGLGHKGRALSEYSQAVELDPDNSMYQMELGQLLLEFKNYRMAQFHLERAHQLCDGCMEAKRLLGHLFLSTDNFQGAIPFFREILAEDGASSSRRNLVMAMQEAGEDSLLVDLLGSWPVGQLQADELHLLISAERRLGQYVIAAQFLGKRLEKDIIAIPPVIYDRHQFWGDVAYSLLLAGQLEDALKGFELALELDPENHIYSNNRQVALQKISKRESNE